MRTLVAVILCLALYGCGPSVQPAECQGMHLVGTVADKIETVADGKVDYVLTVLPVQKGQNAFAVYVTSAQFDCYKVGHWYPNCCETATEVLE